MEEIEELKRQGLSIRAISRLTGFDRKTITKHLESPGIPTYAARPSQPGKLDEGRSRPRVPGAPDPPVPIHRPALVRHRGDADITRKLTAVVEAAIEHFAGQHRSEVVADAPDA